MDTVLISLIVFGGFLLSVAYLLRKRGTTPRSSRRGTDNAAPETSAIRFRQNNAIFRRVSVTISIFTAVFLTCNLPMFCFYVLDNVIFWFNMDEAILDWPGIYWYGMLIGYVVMTALNSAINPCLYIARMAMFREYINDWRGTFVGWFLRRFKCH